MVIFDWDGSLALEENNMGCKTGKRLKKIIPQGNREKIHYCKFLKIMEVRAGLRRSQPKVKLKLRETLRPSWSVFIFALIIIIIVSLKV